MPKKGQSKVATPAASQAADEKLQKPWARISKGGLYTKCDPRHVDEAGISDMLQRRMAAKAKKDWTTADSIAAELQAIGKTHKEQTWTKVENKYTTQTKIACNKMVVYQCASIVLKHGQHAARWFNLLHPRVYILILARLFFP